MQELLSNIPWARCRRFAAVGLGVLAFDFALLGIFRQVMPPLAAVSVAYVLAVTLHFCLNKWWVFQSRSPACAGEVARYLLNLVACWLCTVGCVELGLRWLGPNLYLAKALALPPTTLLAFLLLRFFVFPAASARS